MISETRKIQYAISPLRNPLRVRDKRSNSFIWRTVLQVSRLAMQKRKGKRKKKKSPIDGAVRNYLDLLDVSSSVPGSSSRSTDTFLQLSSCYLPDWPLLEAQWTEVIDLIESRMREQWNCRNWGTIRARWMSALETLRGKITRRDANISNPSLFYFLAATIAR